MKIIFAVLIALVALLGVRFTTLGKQSQTRIPDTVGISNGRLHPCPDKPNCVSSQADPSDQSHWIAPLQYQGAPSEAKSRLLSRIRNTPGTTVVEETDTYFRVECRSRLFGFVDDFEVYFPSGEPGVIHVRSASRVGHSDLGVNRKRVESLRSS